MNYDQIDSEAGCEELLSELPQMFANLMAELEDCFKANCYRQAADLKIRKMELDRLQDKHTEAGAEKQKLRQEILNIEKKSEKDSSYFIYSEKELQEELEYQKKVVSYAKRKICLYQLLGSVEWNAECCKGRILKTNKDFDLSDLDVYQQVNTLWDLI